MSVAAMAALAPHCCLHPSHPLCCGLFTFSCGVCSASFGVVFWVSYTDVLPSCICEGGELGVLLLHCLPSLFPKHGA